MIKILITDKLAKEAIDLINAADDTEAIVKTGPAEEELVAMIGQYDGLIVRSATKVTAKVLSKHGKLRAIARAGAGVDNIDVVEADKKGIVVMNTPGGNTTSVAELVLAMMLGLCRNIVTACNSLKAGQWEKKKFMGTQLNKKVLGIIGLGRIGMTVAKMAAGFDMKLIGYDPFVTPPDAKRLGVEIADKVERIYREADYITVHIPKTEKTINMIAAEQIKMMKPTVRLINTSRGGIINEDDLYDALAGGKIAGAAVDVFTQEPPQNTRFKDFENCIVTPHIGANSTEAQIECGLEAARIIIDYLKGKGARNVVKPKK